MKKLPHQASQSWQGKQAERQRRDRDERRGTFKDFVYTIEFIELISRHPGWHVLVGAGTITE